jgi:hypothetical protein
LELVLNWTIWKIFKSILGIEIWFWKFDPLIENCSCN